MDLNLFSLKVFLKVAEVRSFTKAAEDLFLSQPAVSLQIQKLEQQFQVQFFFRPHSGRIRLTQAGEALKPHVERMIQLHDSIIAGMSRYSPALQREIRIGTCCIAGEHLIPMGLDAFRRAHPEASPSLSITKCEDVFDGLLHGRFDIGVTGLAPKARDLEKKLLLKAPLLFFAAPTEHGKPRRISVKQLSDQRLILREKGAGCRVELERFCVRHGVPLKNLTVVTESESNEAIIKLVKEGYGIAVLPDFMIRQDIHNGTLSEISLQEGQPLQSFFLVYPKQAPQSLLLRNLLSSFKKHAMQAAALAPTHQHNAS